MLEVSHGTENVVKQPEEGGTVSMYWVRYCELRPPLLLDENQTRVYTQMMRAIKKGSPRITKA